MFVDDACHITAEEAERLALDQDLTIGCTADGALLPDLWRVAERYVRRGDAFHVAAGMKIIAENAGHMPSAAALELLEWRFGRRPFRSQPSHPDAWSFRAAVAVALTSQLEEPDRPALAGRVTVLLARAHALATSDQERDLAHQAAVAVRNGDTAWYEERTIIAGALLHGTKLDPELVERTAPAWIARRFVDAVREAMIVLEERARSSAILSDDLVGARLFKEAFDPQNPDSANPGTTMAERIGFVDTIRGPFQLFRNPAVHHFTELDSRRSLELIRLVDFQLGLIRDGLTARHSPTAFLAPSEERTAVRVERAIDADLDDDGELERLVAFLHRSPFGWDSLDFLVLKRAAGAWRREALLEGIPARRIASHRVVTIAPDVRAAAVWVDRGDRDGELLLVTRNKGRYQLLMFDNIRDRSHPQPGLWFALRDGPPVLRDADGDGFPEVYATLAASIDIAGDPDVERWTGRFAFDGSKMSLQAVLEAHRSC